MNFILKNENAVFYECGYSCDNELFLSIDGRNFFLTDGRYTIEAKSNCEKNCEVIEIKSSLISEVRKLLRKFKIKNLIYDPFDFSYQEFLEISKFMTVNFISKPFFSKEKRIIKTKEEIDILKKASTLGAKCFDEFADFINKNKNLSEKELFFNAQNIFRQKGELDLSFNPIVAINQNAAKAHALPTKDILKAKDLLLLDAGVRYKKYCSDRTRTSFYDCSLNFQKEQKFTNQKQQEVYEIVKEAQRLAINAIKPDMKACEIDKVARDFISKYGFGKNFSHSTGHGVGIDIHEFPNINSKSKTNIKEGMVFSVEPGVYIEGEFGVRIEDVVVVTKDGCEIL